MTDLPVTHALFSLGDCAAFCALCGEQMPTDEWDICESCIARADALDVPRTSEGHRL